MNIIALISGVVHTPINSRTACKTRIRKQWQLTDAPLTCPVCIERAPFVTHVYAPLETPPDPVEIVEPPEILTIEPLTIAEMLDQLNCQIIDELLIIQVVAGAPEATVTIRRSELRAWCERRLAARAAHKNKCVRGGSGPPSLGTIRLM